MEVLQHRLPMWLLLISQKFITLTSTAARMYSQKTELNTYPDMAYVNESRFLHPPPSACLSTHSLVELDCLEFSDLALCMLILCHYSPTLPVVFSFCQQLCFSLSFSSIQRKCDHRTPKCIPISSIYTHVPSMWENLYVNSKQSQLDRPIVVPGQLGTVCQVSLVLFHLEEKQRSSFILTKSKLHIVPCFQIYECLL